MTYSGLCDAEFNLYSRKVCDYGFDHVLGFRDVRPTLLFEMVEDPVTDAKLLPPPGNFPVIKSVFAFYTTKGFWRLPQQYDLVPTRKA